MAPITSRLMLREVLMPGYTIYISERHSVNIDHAPSLREAIAEAMETYQGNTPTIVVEVYDEEGRELDPETGDILSPETD